MTDEHRLRRMPKGEQVEIAMLLTTKVFTIIVIYFFLLQHVLCCRQNRCYSVTPFGTCTSGIDDEVSLEEMRREKDRKKVLRTEGFGKA
jgi:hypothetical protein